MKDLQKRQIAEGLRVYCERVGSQNAAANTLNGVSSATISKVLSGKWETIADEMWRSIGAQTGLTVEGWQVVNTRAYDVMSFTLENAQADALVLAVTGEAGSGKTEAVKNYAAGHANAFHIRLQHHRDNILIAEPVIRNLQTLNGGQFIADHLLQRLLHAGIPIKSQLHSKTNHGRF